MDGPLAAGERLLPPHLRRDAAHRVAEQGRRQDVQHLGERGEQQEQRTGDHGEEQTLQDPRPLDNRQFLLLQIGWLHIRHRRTDGDGRGEPQLHVERPHAGESQAALRHLGADHFQLPFQAGHLTGIPQAQLRHQPGHQEELLQQVVHPRHQLPRRAQLTQMGERDQQRDFHAPSEELAPEPHRQLHPHVEFRQHEAEAAA